MANLHLLEIQLFISNPYFDFDEGLQLFVKYSNNRAVLHYLMRKRDRDKLLYELQKMSKLAGLKPVRQFHKVPAIVQRQADKAFLEEKGIVVEPPFIPEGPEGSDGPSTDPGTEDDPGEDDQHKPDTGDQYVPWKINRADLHPVQQVMYDKIAEYYKLQRVYHEKMKLATTDADRAAMRAKVVEYDDLIAAGHDAMDNFVAPAEPAVETKPDPAQTHKEINNARVVISRILKKYDPSKKAELLEKIALLESHNESVNQKTRAKLIELNVIKAETNTMDQ